MSFAPTRPSLLLQLRDSQNRQAWEDFVRVYVPLIHGFCRRRGVQEADAADIAQEVMRAVVRTIHGFEYNPGRGRFRHWLLTITRNKLNNFFNKRSRLGENQGDTDAFERLAELPSDEEEKEWDGEYCRRLFEWAARQVADEVQPKTWEAFRLTAIEGRAGEDVATELGLSVGAVYVGKSRVIARLRELVESVADDPPHLEGLIR